MTDVFGQEHMGYVEPTDDPFASSDSDVEDAPTNCTNPSTSDPQDESDPFADNSDTDYSELEYSKIQQQMDDCDESDEMD